uniref:G-protein coupled receptors family 1 profile domain-containing protein n=1 Tax=Equus caballus TaxID=9796 RepID=A0A9L0T0V7_HORSE
MEDIAWKTKLHHKGIPATMLCQINTQITSFTHTHTHTHTQSYNGIQIYLIPTCSLSAMSFNHQSNMNNSIVTELMILGLSQNPELQGDLFIVFLLIYLVAFLGKFIIVIAIIYNITLHTPMYVLLLSLAIVDIICTTSIIPKMLETMLTSGRTISYRGCMSQLFFFMWSLGAGMVLFTTMAYDRYVAICFPLHYSTVMNHHMCMALLSIVMAIAVTNSWLHIGLILKLTFCGPNTIDHFFCEIPPMLSLSCSPVKINEVMVYIADITLAVGDFTLTCISYAFIIATILRIRTAAVKRKAFSTCSSHLIVVSLYYCL